MLRSATSSRVLLQHCASTTTRRARVPQTSKKNSCWNASTTRRRSTSSSSSSPKPSNDKENPPSLLTACLSWYSTKLDTHPIATKCFTSGLVSAAGDLICQSLTAVTAANNNDKDDDDDDEQSPSSSSTTWDMARTGRFATLGALWIGPILHYWYGGLFRVLSHQVVGRVVVDQFVFSPVFLTSFLSLLWTWEAKVDNDNNNNNNKNDGDADNDFQLVPRLQAALPSILLANWALWIPAQTINFKFVPIKYQVLFSNMVALAWNAYLSYTTHEAKQLAVVAASAVPPHNDEGGVTQ